jgi:hypothetical protein
MEELYRQLYAKYSPGLSQEELNSKLQYASEQDPGEFINAFYQKYTGSGPSEEQANYISNYINQPEEPSNREKIIEMEKEPSFWDLYNPFSKADKIKSMNDALIDIDGEYNQNEINEIIAQNDKYRPIADYTKDFQKDIEDKRRKFRLENGEEPNMFEDTAMAFQAFGNNPKQALLTTYESLIQNPISLFSGDKRALTMSAVVAGANAMRKQRTLSGKIGSFAGSMYALAQGQVDSAYALDELLVEELGQGYSGEDLKALMEDKDRFQQLRLAALGKGATTAAVDKLGVKLSVNRFGKANTAVQKATGSKVLGIGAGFGAAIGTEGTLGAVAEATGSVAKDVIAGKTLDEAISSIDGVELAGEFLGEGVVGGPIALSQAFNDIGTSQYTLNGKEHSQADFMNLTGAMTDEQLAQITFDVKNNSSILEGLEARRKDGVIKNNLDTRVTDEGDRTKLFELEKELQGLESKGSVTQSQKNQISNKKAEIKDITNSYFERNKQLEENKKATEQAQVKQVLGADIAEGMGGKTEILSQEEIKNKYGDEASNGAGFITEDGKAVLNKDVSLNNGMLNVAAHEFIHQALNARLNNKATSAVAQKAIEKFKQNMSKNNADIHAQVLDQFKKRKYTNEEVTGVNSDEYLAQLADLMSKDKSIARKIQGKGRIESFIDNVKDLISEALGIPKAELNFETADDVTNFMIAHNKAFANKKADKRFKKFTSEKLATTGKRKFSKVNLDQDADPGPIVDALTKGAKTKAEFQSANGGFGQVYEAIIDGDFDKLFGSGLNKQQKDLAREELANRLVNYDPSKTPSLYKWFGSNIVYAKREANKALAIEAKKDKQTKSIDQAKKNAEGDSFATQIEDTTELTPDEILDLKLAEERKAKQAPVKVKETLRRKMGFERDGKVHNRIKKAIKTNILRKMMVTRSALKKDIATGQYKKGDKITEAVDITDLRWQKEISRALGLDLQETMYEVMGRSTVDYTNFLDQFIEEAFEMMDQNLINNRYKDLVVKVIDRQGSKQSSLDKKVKSKTAGNAKFEKVPKTKEELIQYFLKRGRKESLAQVLAIEFAHDATMEVLAEPEIMSKAEQVLVNKGNFKNQALRSIIGKQIGRDPDLKFSKVDGTKIVEKLNKDNLDVTKANVKNTIASLLPDETKAEIQRLTNDIYNPIKRFIEKVIGEDKGVNINVDEFLKADKQLKITDAEFSNSLLKLFTGETGKMQTYYDPGSATVTKGRTATVDYLHSKFKPDMSEAEVKAAIKILGLHRKHNTSAGVNKQRAARYYQFFYGSQDFNETVVKPLEKYGITYAENISYKKDGEVNSVVTKYFFDGKEIQTLTAPSTSTLDGKRKTAKQRFQDNYKKQFEYTDPAWNEANSYIKYIVKSKKIDPVVKAMLATTMKQDMQGLFKSAAPVEFFFEGKHKGPRTYEHMLATQFALTRLVLFYDGKSKLTPDQLKAKYKVAIIPKVMDDNINIQFRQGTIADIVKDPIDKRYYNPATWGYKNIFAIKSLNPKKPEVLGQGWVLTDAQASKIATPQERALMMAKDNVIAKFSKVEKGMSIFDFDDTLAQSNSKVGVTMPNGKKRKITATEFAVESADLEAAGAAFDFSEFNKVIDGKKGPFFDLAQQINSKFGNKDIYVLTARPQEAAYAIHAFLKGMGLNIPIENITGLEDGKASAKANWVVNKINSGYNNILFADDAIKNVQAVKEVLEAANVKNDVKLAQVKFSKTLDENFNTILERKSGINKNEEYSRAAGKAAGLGKGKYKFWMPPSAEDFVGLMYNMLPEGKAGEKSFKFFTQALIDPYWAGVRSLNAAKQALGNDFYALKKRFPKAFRSLLKDVGYKQYSNEQAIRVYLWNKAGFEIPGMSKVDIEKLSDIVRNNHNMRGFADLVGATTKLEEGYIKPGQDWVSGTIAYDYFSIAQKTNRKKYLANWIERKNEIFSEKNMNKIEAIYGEDYRSALEDILWRMENGTNRTTGKNKLVNSWMNWVNNSVGAIMFFNSRSAILQTISMINFINWSDNNPLKAGMAFANQPQFWSDFSMIFNSDMLKQRRAGLQSDVNEAEIAQAVAGKTDKASAAISYLLKKGFLPTQMADSFAISMGGASFYRNRFNTYKSQGMTEAQAKDKAFADFAKTSEESQQSADPALISQQQAGPLGRLVLAFQNTPMQYARLIKKAVLDIKNGRGDVKTNISKILYYGVLQNIIFSTLQSGLFALAFDDEEDEELTQKLENKKLRALNTSLDSLLRGGGVYGAGISTIKNMILQFNAQNDKGYRADHAYTMIEAVNLSPPIGSKIRKIYSATQTYKFNKKIIPQMGMGIDNPAYLAIANIVSATTNVPLDRAIMKLNNLRAAADSQNQAWQRVATFLGWNTWDVGVKNTAVEKAKAKNKKSSSKRKTKYRK